MQYGPDMVIVLDPFSNNNLSFFKAIEELSIKLVVHKGAVRLSQKRFSQGLLSSM